MNNIFPPNQRRFLSKAKHLSSIFQKSGFVLMGGTALALHLGHRRSVDFDFVSPKPFDAHELLNSVSTTLMHIEVSQLGENTLEFSWEDVKVSFFGGIDFPLLDAVTTRVGLRLLSVRDILAMKIATILKRASVRDYFDVAFAIKFKGFSVRAILDDFYTKYGSQGRTFPPQIILKSLTYLDDVTFTEIHILKHKSFWLKGGLKHTINHVMIEAVKEYIEKV